MAKTRSVFELNSSAAQSFTVKIDEDVLNDMKALEDRLKKEAPEKSFPRARIVQAALEQAIEAGNAELDEQGKKRKTRGPGAAAEPASQATT